MNTLNTSEPTISRPLTAADLTEIRENRIRLGLHIDGERCYCPECVDHRNPNRKSNMFRQKMLKRGFTDYSESESSVLDDITFIWNRIGDRAFAESLGLEDGEKTCDTLPLDGLIAPTNSLSQRIQRARFEKQYGISGAAKTDHDYTKWKTPANLHAIQPRRVHILGVTTRGTNDRFFTIDVNGESVVTPAADIKLIDGLAVVGDSGSPTKYGSVPSPSTGRLNFDIDYLRSSMHPTTLPAAKIIESDVVDPFKDRAVLIVNTESRTTARRKNGTEKYTMGVEWVQPERRPDAATYTGSCVCPHHGKANGHFAKTFVYPDGSTRYECDHESPLYQNYLMVFKPSNFAQSETVKPNKNWKRDWERARANGEIAVHSIYEKRRRTSSDSSEDLGVDIHVDNESGDEIGIATPAEAHGLDWIEDDMTRESKDSAFDIDAEKLLELAKKFYGVDLRYVTHEDVLRDPHFSNFARAYVIRVRYADGYKISDSEKRQLRREVEYMTKMIDGKCPSGTCPNDRCASPDLTLSERAATHAANLPHTREKMFNRVGQWYCVIVANDQPYIKWLPDPSEFDGETEHDRVEAAFDELVRTDLLSVARDARKVGGDPDEAVKRRQAAFDAVAEISKVVSEEFEKSTVESTSSDQLRG